jgi:hypothetical protein
MHIVIGPTHAVEATGTRNPATMNAPVEARVLEVRATRERPGNPPNGQKDRRAKKDRPDPKGGRVMLLLVPEGFKVPKDIESGNYKILLRFVPIGRQG